MNKEKLTEVKKIVMHEIGQALERSTQQEISFDKQMAIAEALGDSTATLDDKIDNFIQSEPEEYCEYCQGSKSLYYSADNDYIREVYIEEDGTLSVFNPLDIMQSVSLEISYCPKCGRKIKVGE